MLAAAIAPKLRGGRSAAALPGSARAERLRATGDAGELLVADALRKLGLPMLRNVVLGPPRRTVELDHVVRVADGIVVLETKTLGGSIDGHPEDGLWTQRARHGAYAFRNPLRQNLAHVRAVEAFIGNRRVPIWGHVASAGHARFVAALVPAIVPIAELSWRLGGRVAYPANAAPIEKAWRGLVAEATRSERRMPTHVATACCRAACVRVT